jgi:hypothetical protein
MQVVMLYSDGDGCTYSCDCTHPIHHESPEAARVEFDELCAAALSKKSRWQVMRFMFCGMEFDPMSFYIEGQYYPPDFLTVQEWFDQQGSQA